jgi:hypothetical protein
MAERPDGFEAFEARLRDALAAAADRLVPPAAEGADLARAAIARRHRARRTRAVAALVACTVASGLAVGIGLGAGAPSARPVAAPGLRRSAAVANRNSATAGGHAGSFSAAAPAGGHVNQQGDQAFSPAGCATVAVAGQRASCAGSIVPVGAMAAAGRAGEAALAAPAPVAPRGRPTVVVKVGQTVTVRLPARTGVLWAPPVTIPTRHPHAPPSAVFRLLASHTDPTTGAAWAILRASAVGRETLVATGRRCSTGTPCGRGGHEERWALQLQVSSR